MGRWIAKELTDRIRRVDRTATNTVKGVDLMPFSWYYYVIPAILSLCGITFLYWKRAAWQFAGLGAMLLAGSIAQAEIAREGPVEIILWIAVVLSLVVPTFVPFAIGAALQARRVNTEAAIGAAALVGAIAVGASPLLNLLIWCSLTGDCL